MVYAVGDWPREAHNGGISKNVRLNFKDNGTTLGDGGVGRGRGKNKGGKDGVKSKKGGGAKNKDEEDEDTDEEDDGVVLDPIAAARAEMEAEAILELEKVETGALAS